MSVAKNVGKANGTTAKTQAMAEAKSSWDQKADKEYFENVKDVDSYELFKFLVYLLYLFYIDL